jgi:SAM-dependent methyltransferase
VAHDLFDRLGVRRGWRVLEVGPGQGSLYAELQRRVRGPVDAVEHSGPFAQRLRRLAARDGRGGQIWETDLLAAPLPRSHYDLIFARWVFLFLPDPITHLRKLVRTLRPGGLLVLEDYDRRALDMIPRPPEWGDFVAGERACFAARGADVSIGGKLPELYRRVGLRVEEVTPIIQVGHPGSPVWNWLSDFFLGMMDRYAKFPPFSPAKAARLRRRWAAAGRNRAALLFAPVVLDIVGRKPGKRGR